MKLIYILFICILATLVTAPPSLLNHQFYGDVVWNGTVLKQEVKAVIGSSEYTSQIEDGECTAGDCTGKYGIAEDNILRVQGSNGDLVTFYVDGERVNEFVYEADASTELVLDFGNIPALPVEACDVDWGNCSFSECIDGFKEQTCYDENECDATNLVRVQNVTCTGGTVTNVTNDTTPEVIDTNTGSNTPTVTNCEYQWQCSTFSTCVSGLKSRTCSRVDTCDLKYSANPAGINVIAKPRPAETESCVVPTIPEVQKPLELESCFDDIKNQNEEDVDCGGVCSECSSTPWYYWGAPLILVVLIGLGVGSYFMFTHGGAPPLSPQQQQQLTNYFRTGMARGMSKEQIMGNLVKSGWKSSVVKKYMKKV